MSAAAVRLVARSTCCALALACVVLALPRKSAGQATGPVTDAEIASYLRQYRQLDTLDTSDEAFRQAFARHTRARQLLEDVVLKGRDLERAIKVDIPQVWPESADWAGLISDIAKALLPITPEDWVVKLLPGFVNVVKTLRDSKHVLESARDKVMMPSISEGFYQRYREQRLSGAGIADSFDLAGLKGYYVLRTRGTNAPLSQGQSDDAMMKIYEARYQLELLRAQQQTLRRNWAAERMNLVREQNDAAWTIIEDAADIQKALNRTPPVTPPAPTEGQPGSTGSAPASRACASDVTARRNDLLAKVDAQKRPPTLDSNGGTWNTIHFGYSDCREPVCSQRYKECKAGVEDRYLKTRTYDPKYGMRESMWNLEEWLFACDRIQINCCADAALEACGVTPASSPAPPPPPQPTATPDTRPPSSISFGRNLVANPGGESDHASPDGRDVVRITGWVVTGNLTLARYDSPNEQYAGIRASSRLSRPPDAGTNFFTGGPDNSGSSATQTLAVAGAVADIDNGSVRYELSGYLGGYGGQNDSATVVASFRSASGGLVGEARIGPVSDSDRGGQDGLIRRNATGTLPGGTRTVILTLSMSRSDGRYNDGYADDIAFTLKR